MVILALATFVCFVWAIVATAAAIDAQDRCTRAQEREDRLRREYFGEVSS